ncbi:hypothetical protein [Streptomyces sp. NPDC046984]|uniref:hypothetical protein n=1 Tax=unclassified Streptomyces TaxID=2593676 RepID=UPI0033E93D71
MSPSGARPIAAQGRQPARHSASARIALTATTATSTAEVGRTVPASAHRMPAHNQRRATTAISVHMRKAVKAASE